MAIGQFMPFTVSGARTRAPSIPDPNIDYVKLSVGMVEWLNDSPTGNYPLDTSVNGYSSGISSRSPNRSEDSKWGGYAVQYLGRVFASSIGNAVSDWDDIRTEDFTIEFWYQLNSLSNTSIFASMNRFGAGIGLLINSGATMVAAGGAYTSLPGVLITGQWQHISFNATSSTFTLRVDGVVVWTDVRSTVHRPLVFGGNIISDTTVGGDSGTNAYDDIRVWLGIAIRPSTGSIVLPTGPWESPT